MYFGHPVNIYGHPAENKIVEMIGEIFPEYPVENPNQQKYSDGYRIYGDVSIDPVMQERMGISDKRGMNYYFLEVLPKMQAGAFLAFEDGMFGKGVYGEAEFIAGNNGDIYKIGFNESSSLYIASMALDPSRCLTVDETRARVRGPNKDSLGNALELALSKGDSFIPYM